MVAMINGAHLLLFSRDAERDRAFFRDVLGFGSVDAGGGWLIFGLPPAELATHPTDGDAACELYLMCDDVAATVGQLRAEGVEVTRPVSDEGWGLLTAFRLPSGAEIGLYEPKHPRPDGTWARPCTPGSPDATNS
ncbi:VOC family protein [Saccharopolyspora sp. 5N708]|uniref:VOC family protein n=1 Tax=Saccharopolyspora sp. 5N708 TaxID=3457424 RepID=UPI003FD16408